MTYSCSFCDRPIDPNGKGVHRKITGWERNRSAGEGVHPMKDRQYHMEFVHDLCLDVKLKGSDPKKMYVKEPLL